MQCFKVVYHEISQASLVFSRYTREAKLVFIQTILHSPLKCLNNSSKKSGNDIFTVLKIKVVSSLDTKFSSLEKFWYFISVYIIIKK